MKHIYYCLIIMLSLHFSTNTITVTSCVRPFINKAYSALYFLASYFIPASAAELMQTKKDILDIFEEHYHTMQRSAQKNTDDFFNKCSERLHTIECATRECHQRVIALRKNIQRTKQQLSQHNTRYHHDRVGIFKNILQEYLFTTKHLHESLAQDSASWHHALQETIQIKSKKVTTLLHNMRQQHQRDLNEIKNTLYTTHVEQQKDAEYSLASVKQQCEYAQKTVTDLYKNQAALIENVQQQCNQQIQYYTTYHEQTDKLYDRIAALVARYQNLKKSSLYTSSQFSKNEKNQEPQGMV